MLQRLIHKQSPTEQPRADAHRPLRRVLAAALCACLMLTLLPANALAAETQEQFNLTTAETYYFLDGGEWTPYTYVGTINAYALKNAQETAQTVSAYDHSLFVANRTVSSLSSLYGTDFTYGGITYTKRAMSGGNEGAGDYQFPIVDGVEIGVYQHGSPSTNEWDTIKRKSPEKYGSLLHYPTMVQDISILETSVGRRVNRNNSDKYSWRPDEQSASYRPVLEVPASLQSNADALKAITINLNGGKMGNSAEPFKTVVNSNQSYTAPAWHSSFVLPAIPSGASSIEFAGWNTKADGTGTSYAAGASVPTSVSTLYAIYKAPTTAPSFSQSSVKFATTDATTVTLTDNNGADGRTYKIYAAATGGSALETPTVSVDQSNKKTLTLTFTSQPDALTQYYISATVDGREESARRMIAIQPAGKPVVALQKDTVTATFTEKLNQWNEFISLTLDPGDEQGLTFTKDDFMFSTSATQKTAVQNFEITNFTYNSAQKNGNISMSIKRAFDAPIVYLWYKESCLGEIYVIKQFSHVITIDNAIQNGTVTAKPSPGIEDKDVALTVTPGDGYKLDAISVYKTGDTATTVPVYENEGAYSFTMPDHAVTVTATFKGSDAPALYPEQTAFETADANTVTFNLSDAPESTTYKVYAAETGGEALTDPAASVTEGVLTLTFTNKPAEETKYYISATTGSLVESSRTEVTVSPYVAPTYGVTLDPSADKTFTAATVGYGEQTAHSVTVNNSGNQPTGDLTVALSGTNSGSFTLSKTTISSIDPEGSDSFTVKPNTSLAAGTYTATVTVSGGNSISASFGVSFTVNTQAPTTHSVTYTLTNLTANNQPGTVNDSAALSATLTAASGYKLPGAITVTMGGAALEAGTGYTYNSTTGAVSITSVTGAVVITAAGVAKSSDATLSALSYKVDQGTETPVPSFAAATTTYNVTLPAGTGATAAITMTGTAATGARITTNAGVTLSGGTGTATVTVTAENGSTTKTYTVNFTTATTPPPSGTAPTITTTSLPDGAVGTAYTATLAATGTTPITWSVSVGSLPGGLNLNTSTGVISGTPTTAGTSTFTVKASNGTSPDATKQLSIKIDAATPPQQSSAKQITVFTIENQVGNSVINQQNHTIAVTMPTGTAVTSLTPTITVSDKATVSPASGTAQNFTNSVTYTVTAEDNSTQTYTVTVTVQAPSGTAPAITTESLSNGTMGTAYSATLAATGDAPISWSVESGSLPAGLSLSGAVISGTPTAAGTSTFTVKAENSTGSATKELTIKIDAATQPGVAPEITTATLTGGTVGEQYTATLAATGDAPISWTVSAGSLPNGLTLNGNTIGGTPTTAGTFTFTVKASNATGEDTQELSIAISAPEATVTGVTVSPSAATVKKGTTQQFTATVTGTNGPSQDVTWTIEGNHANGTTITGGLLTVAADEAETTLTVKATSDADGSKSATATVTVTDQEVTRYTLTVTDGSGSGDYAENTEIAVTAETKANKRFKEWTASGITLADATENPVTITMPAGAVTLTATYEDVYAVTATGDGNGTATASPATAAQGDTVNITASANSGYQFKEWQVISGGITLDANASTSFTMPGQAVEVKAIFEATSTPPTTTYTVIFNANGGSVTPGTAQTNEQGKLTSLPTPTRSGSYRFDYWQLSDGTQVTLNTKFTDNTTVTAHWTYTGTSGGGNNSSNTTTETTKNPDGSTTTTTTDKRTGTVTETTKAPDGTKTVVETKKDGTVTETVNKPDGTETETVKTPEGKVTETLKRPDGVKTETVTEKNGETTAKVTVPSSKDSVTVTLPVKDAAPGTVAVIVHADGTEEIVKKSIYGEDGLTLTLEDSATLKIVDNSKQFNDVPENAWYADAVDFASSRDLFQGTGTDTFSPGAKLNRGMFVTVLYRLENEPETAGADFGDVPDGAYYEKAVAWATANNIAAGIGNGQYAPGRDITRQELAAMIYRYAGHLGLDLSAGSADLDGFKDSEQVSGFAQDPMKWCVANGIISGKGNGVLDPSGNATRAEAVSILMRFVELLAK